MPPAPRGSSDQEPPSSCPGHSSWPSRSIAQAHHPAWGPKSHDNAQSLTVSIQRASRQRINDASHLCSDDSTARLALRQNKIRSGQRHALRVLARGNMRHASTSAVHPSFFHRPPIGGASGTPAYKQASMHTCTDPRTRMCAQVKCMRARVQAHAETDTTMNTYRELQRRASRPTTRPFKVTRRVLEHQKFRLLVDRDGADLLLRRAIPPAKQ